MTLIQLTIVSVLQNIKYGAGLAAKSTGYYTRTPGFGSQHSHGSSQLPITPVLALFWSPA